MPINFDKFPTEPEKRLVPPDEKPEITKRKLGMVEDLKEGRLDDISKKERATVVDFQGLPEGSTENDFLKWIEREIEIPPEVILGKNKEESGPTYRLLNYAFQEAKVFMKDTLKYGDKDISIGPETISSQKDIFDLLRNTVLAKEKRTGLSRAPQYCRLVKATIVAYETLKHDAELLKETTADFENALISPVSKNNTEVTPLVLLTESNNKKKFFANDDGTITGTISFRGKDVSKAMLRFITRPDSNAKEALKDGIACIITIEKEGAKKLIPIICEWLNKKMGVAYVRISNQSLFSKEDMSELEKLLKNSLEDDSSFKLKDSEATPTSMGDYKSAKILGILQSSESDVGLKSKHSRQFEIQIVTPDNKNEKGKMHHSIYDVVKLVNARTRLDGGCPEHVFKEFVKDASAESGMSEATIEKYLIEAKNPPIVKIYKKSPKGVRTGKPIYVAHSVYTRWDGFGWVDDSLMRDIENAKERKTR